MLISLWLFSPLALAQSNAPSANNEPIIKYSGPESSIQRFLCTPNMSDTGVGTKDDQGVLTDTATQNPSSGDLAVCINRLYRFGGAIGAFAGVFFVALSGYYYILGGEHGKEKAKHTIVSVIAGLAIIFTAYIFLKQINPEAIKFKPIQPPQLGQQAKLPGCEELGLGDCIIKVSDSNVSKENDSGGNYAKCSGGLVSTQGLKLPNDGEADTKQICQDLGAKLAAAATKYSQATDGKYYFLIGQTIGQAGQSPSESSCHYPNNASTGNCADLSPRLKSTDKKPSTSDKEPWLQLCQALQAEGVDVLVESIDLQGCGHKPLSDTNATSAHFHVSVKQ